MCVLPGGFLLGGLSSWGAFFLQENGRKRKYTKDRHDVTGVRRRGDCVGRAVGLVQRRATSTNSPREGGRSKWAPPPVPTAMHGNACVHACDKTMIH